MTGVLPWSAPDPSHAPRVLADARSAAAAGSRPRARTRTLRSRSCGRRPTLPSTSKHFCCARSSCCAPRRAGSTHAPPSRLSSGAPRHSRWRSRPGEATFLPSTCDNNAGSSRGHLPRESLLISSVRLWVDPALSGTRGGGLCGLGRPGAAPSRAGARSWERNFQRRDVECSRISPLDAPNFPLRHDSQLSHLCLLPLVGTCRVICEARWTTNTPHCSGRQSPVLLSSINTARDLR